MRIKKNMFQSICLILTFACCVLFILTAKQFIMKSQKPELLLPKKFLKSNLNQQSPGGPDYPNDVTCLLITSPSRHGLARHMTATWIQECTDVVTMTSANGALLRNVQITKHSSYEELWGKVLNGFYIMNYSKTSWFMKVDDDTFVVMKNLKNFLSKHNPDQPLLMGLQLLYPDNKNFSVPLPYVSGGAGYVLSRQALKRLQNVKSHGCSYSGVTAYEDVNMGNCLHSVGVQQVDTRDQLGRSRFLPYPPWIIMQAELQDDSKYLWLQRESKYTVKFGTEYLTDEPISFHEVRDVNEVYQLHYFFNIVKIPT